MSKVRAPKLSLREIQTLMGEVIMNPLDLDFESQATLADGRSVHAVAAQFSKANDRLDSTERMAIYNRQYWYRLIDSLYDDFPGLLAIVGKPAFNVVIRAYLTAHPSRSYSLRDLGHQLSSFVARHPELCEPHPLAAAQMTAFEWAQIVAFDGQAREPVTQEYLSAHAPEELFFSLQPYLSLLELAYPFDDFILLLHKQDEVVRSEAGVSELAAAHVDEPHASLPNPEQVFLVVHRFENSLYYKRLERGAFVLLKQLRDGQSLAQGLAAVVAVLREDEVCELPQKIERWFAVFTELRWLCPAVADTGSLIGPDSAESRSG